MQLRSEVRSGAAVGGRSPIRSLARAGGLVILALLAALPASAQQTQVVDLTLRRAVELAMEGSYQIRRVRMQVEQTRFQLTAERAALRSRVTLNFSTPRFERISEPRWNSTLQRNEIVSENTRRWEGTLAIEQPVSLFGYPTNGVLSLNNRVYRYTQIEEDEHDLSFYNRYFIAYRQPLFQPNALKNNLESAQLDLEQAELDFQSGAINIINNVAETYYDLFELAYQEQIRSTLVANLEQAVAAATARATADSTRAIDVSQAQVSLANARSQLQQARSDFRLEASQARPALGLAPTDSLVIRPVLEITPIDVDLSRAIELGQTLRPQLRRLDIQRRNGELQLSSVRGRDAFRMNVELSYGREMENEALDNLFEDPSNSYTVGVSGTLPIWDGGARSARIAAQRLAIARTDLSIEETREQIEVDITNTVRNLEEYQSRVRSMSDNLQLAENVTTQTLGQYNEGSATMVDLIQSIDRRQDTAENFLNAYIGYRNAVQNLQQMTYYDFESQSPVLEIYGIVSTVDLDD